MTEENMQSNEETPIKKNAARRFPFSIYFALVVTFAVIFSFYMNNKTTSDTVEFSVVGDIMTHEPQIRAAYNNDCSCYDFANTFDIIAPHLKADVILGNLETTLPGSVLKFAGYPRFGAPDSLITALTKTGFNILTTANNHSVDKGKDGIIRTLDVLDKYGIAHLGTYRSAEEHKQNRVLLVEKNNMKMAFLNYTFSTNGIEIPKSVVVNMVKKKKISADIAHAKTLKPDAIIVIYHFGTEYARQPDSYQKDIVNFTFKEGADIVLGGHPHVLQPFKKLTVKDKYEETKDRFVIYSLGNFVSNQQRRYTDGGIILKFRLRKEEGVLVVDKIQYVPIWVHLQVQDEKRSYTILPVESYLKGENSKTLSENALKRMTLFYTDLTAHYKNVPVDKPE
ncbi:MAG: CapA family protein [Leptospirales bacterium]